MTKQSVIGYILSGQDNDSYMFPEDMSAEIRRNGRARLEEYQVNPKLKFPEVTDEHRKMNKCPFCGYRLDFQPYNKNYSSKGKREIGFTYDGQSIVSSKFKEFCSAKKIEGVVFREFESDKNHFQMILTKEIAFDSVRRGTRFEYLCPSCRNYESVVGADPSYLRIAGPLPSGIFRSDLVFASGNEKHPLIIVSLDIWSELKKGKFKGMEFSPALGLDPI